MHESFPRYRYRITMAFLTVLSWGMVPILVKIALHEATVTEIALCRLILGCLILMLIQTYRGTLQRKELSDAAPACIGGLFFAGHYYCLFRGIELSGPAFAQVLIQSGGLFLIIAGVFVFKEILGRVQVLGVTITLGAMSAFHLAVSGKNSLAIQQTTLAACYLVSSGAAWAVFAALKKNVSQRRSPISYLCIAFAVAALCYVLTVDWENFGLYSSLGWITLACLGTLTASGYLSFGEALRYAPAAQVSTIAATAPLITAGLATLIHVTWPKALPAEQIGISGYLFAALVVLGVTLVIRPAAPS